MKQNPDESATRLSILYLTIVCGKHKEEVSIPKADLICPSYNAVADPAQTLPWGLPPTPAPHPLHHPTTTLASINASFWNDPGTSAGG